jgi:prolipoprotein diacylglyceryl transferase
MLGVIPSPSSGQLHLGPLRLTAYGLMIALGVLAAIELSRRRAPRRGISVDDISAIGLWAVPAGLLGARLYHVITDWRRFEGRWFDTVKVWQGGLGIPGGIVAGVLVGLWVARRRHLSLADAADVVAPAVPLAQAIGRWGNWWNQELFGRPTTLPWGLEIDRANRPARYLDSATFHPTFLYESLWNLALCAVLTVVDRRWGTVADRPRLRRGQLFWLYVGGYGVGRLWVEALRSDEASHLGPFRVNIWVSLFAIAAAILGLVVQGRRGGTRPVGWASAELVQHGVVEGGPGLHGPGPEAEVAEGDAAEAGDRVDPAERAGPAEVTEGPR